MVVYVYQAIGLICNAFLVVLVIRALTSWFVGGGSPTIQKVRVICTNLTEFLVAPCRKFVSRFNNGMFDWSVLLAFLVVVLARDIAQRIILQFFIH